MLEQINTLAPGKIRKSESLANKNNATLLNFTGLSITKYNDGLRIDSNEYLFKLRALDVFSHFSHFKLLHAQLAWATNSRLDLARRVDLLAQISEDRFISNKTHFIKQIDAVARHIKTFLYLGLYFPRLVNHLHESKFIHTIPILAIMTRNPYFGISYFKKTNLISFNPFDLLCTNQNNLLNQFLEVGFWHFLTPLIWHSPSSGFGINYQKKSLPSQRLLIVAFYLTSQQNLPLLVRMN